MPKIPFVGGAYTERSTALDAQTCINLYPIIANPDSKSVTALYHTPGTEFFADLTSTGASSGIRGMLVSNDVLYVVAQQYLWVFTPATGSAYTTATYGIIAGNASVEMAHNGTQLFIATGTAGYLFDGVTVSLLSGDFLAGNGASFIDGYFISGVPNAGQFQISGLYDGAAWSALDVTSVEGRSDNLVALIAEHRELWCFGAETTEIFYNSGASQFPFERVSGAFLEIGCAASNSVARLDSSVYWLAKNDHGSGQVMRADGYQPIVVSTRAIEYAIQSYAVISDAEAFAYQQDGHSFYVLSFPTAGKTWVYDATTNLWHERAWRNPVTGEMGRWRAGCHAFWRGRHYVGDYANATLYTLDLSVFTDDGNQYIGEARHIPIYRERAAQQISLDQKNVVHKSLQVDMETGVGLVSGQGSTPVALLQWSDDGGRSWSNEHSANIGEIGATRTRAIWRRLGVSRNRVYRLIITDPVTVAIYGATLNATAGAS